MKPETKPTPKQIVQMDKELKRLLNTVTKEWLKKTACVEDVTIRSWLQRGRISADAANRIHGARSIDEIGITRESLRPDVEYWYV